MSDVSGRPAFDIFISEAEKQINDLGIQRRVGHRYPFDYLADAYISKSFALVRAINMLIDAGLVDEAFGLSRTLVEIAANIRYMTIEPDELQKRTKDFIRFGRTDRNLWYFWTVQQMSGKPEEERIRKFAEEAGFEEDGLSAYNHWSGIHRDFVRRVTDLVHPLDDESQTPTDRKVQRAFNYYQTSCFVHASITGVDGYFDKESEELHIHTGQSNRDTGHRAMLVASQYLKAVISYALSGMNVELPSSFTCLVRYWYDESIGDYKWLPASGNAGN